MTHIKRIAAGIFLSASLAGCEQAAIHHVELSQANNPGSHERTYYDCDTDLICHENKTRVKFPIGRSIRTNASCEIPLADEGERYQKICEKRFPAIKPD